VLVGGFRLAPAPGDFLRQVMAELKKLNLEQVMPMHCSGQDFTDLAGKEISEKTVLRSSFTFTALNDQAPLGRTTTQGNWRWLRCLQALDAALADKWPRRAR